MAPNFNTICQYDATDIPVYMFTCWKMYRFLRFREVRHSDRNTLKMSDANTGMQEKIANTAVSLPGH